MHLSPLRDADDAAQWLVRELRAIAPGPFDRPVILAHHAALQRRLTLEIARTEGCSASLRMVSPFGWVDEVIGLEGVDREWRSGTVAWRITALITDLAAEMPESAQAIVRQGDAVALLELARAIAHRFRAYLLHRPALLLNWETTGALTTADPAAEAWQCALWRGLVERTGTPSPARTVQAVRDGHLVLPESIPTTILMVADPSLPPTTREMMKAIATHRDVRWGVLRHLSDAPEALGSERLKTSSQVLRTLGLADAAAAPTAPTTLLTAVQGAIRHGRSAVATHHALDRSLSIHSCHSALREIETLRELAIAALESDATLRPDDITLYVTSLTEYLPAIDAVFGVDEPGLPRLPYSVAGRPFSETAPVVLALLRLLEASEGRATLNGIGSLLGIEPIARAARLSEDEVATALHLLTQAGVVWGRNGAERHERFDLPALAAGTWQLGIDRLVLGLATGPSTRSIGEVLPTSGQLAGNGELIGRLADWTDALFAAFDAMRVPKSAAEWNGYLESTIRSFIAVSGMNDARAARTLRDTIRQLLEGVARAAPGAPITLASLRLLIADALENGTGRSGQLRGGLRVCQLQSGSVLTSAVVLVAGMGDALHPAGGGSLAWDLLAKHPAPAEGEAAVKAARAEDPDARADALDAFRELVCSARRSLHVAWTGVTLAKKDKRAPSVAVSELRDIAEHFLSADDATRLIREEPAHPFSARLFDPAPEAASHRSGAKGWARAATLVRENASTPDSFAAEVVAGVAESKVVSLDVLTRCVENPTSHFCTRILGLALGRDEDELADNEPQGIVVKTSAGVRNHYRSVSWRLEEAQRRRDQRTPEEVEAWLRHQPELAYGEEGRVQAAALVEQWWTRLDGVRRIPWLPAQPVSCTVGDWTIEGRLDQLTPDARVVASLFEVKPRSALKQWVPHLVMNLLAKQGADLPRITRVSDGSDWTLKPVENPEAILADLCALCAEASEKPIPLFRSTGIEWLEARDNAPRAQAIDSETAAKARMAAHKAWISTPAFGSLPAHTGEGDSDANRLCWPERDLLDDDIFFDEMASAAERVLLPYLQHVQLAEDA
jgi:exodeoxyribonuclease V gamma subunit